MKRRWCEFWNECGGSIAPLFALVLFALVGLAGVGMDYGRLMTMSSELQNAADQAALAAATQLDGKSDSITRAQQAVTGYFASSAPVGTSGQLIVNQTLLSNDGKGRGITDVSFTFYTSYDSVNDTFGSVTTSGSSARVVLLKVNSRKAFYALTPVIGAIDSGNIDTDAVAGLDSSICQVPPLMVCTPNSDFPSAADKGKGVLMEPGAQVGAWTPGTFGYLDFGNGANAVKALLSSNGNSNVCTGGLGVSAQNGNIASATDAINTRFDVYVNPYKKTDCLADGTNCPAPNTRKDVVRQEVHAFKNKNSQPTRPACSSTLTSSQGNPNPKITVSDWMQLPASALPVSSQVTGFPRDTCHYSGTCAGDKYGDAVWNITGYRNAHPSVPLTLTTRYDIYKWERDNTASGLQPQLANSADPVAISGCKNGQCDYTWTNYCSYPAPINALTANNPARDRRIATVAAVDCATDSTGNHSFEVKRWVDMFLTEPSLNRSSPSTQAYQIYGEVIGPATKPDGSNAFQYYGRNKAVLLR